MISMGCRSIGNRIKGAYTSVAYKCFSEELMLLQAFGVFKGQKGVLCPRLHGFGDHAKLSLEFSLRTKPQYGFRRDYAVVRLATLSNIFGTGIRSNC